MVNKYNSTSADREERFRLSRHFRRESFFDFQVFQRLLFRNRYLAASVYYIWIYTID